MREDPAVAAQGRAPVGEGASPTELLPAGSAGQHLLHSILFSPILVEKWRKGHSVPLLGIPNCVGFGLHAESYR